MLNGLTDELLALYWKYSANPDLAIEAVKEQGHSPAEIREAIEQLIEDEKLHVTEATWLEAALGHYTISEMRLNPGVGDVRERLLKKHPGLLKPSRSPNAGRGDLAAAAFWDLRPYKSSNGSERSMDGNIGTRDAVVVTMQGDSDEVYEVEYFLWEHLIARLVIRDYYWSLYPSNAGYPTNTTHGRLEGIFSVGRKLYGDKLNFYFHSVQRKSKMTVGYGIKKMTSIVHDIDESYIPERWQPSGGSGNARWDLMDAKGKETGQWIQVEDTDDCEECAKAGKTCECQEVGLYDNKTGNYDSVGWATSYDEGVDLAIQYMRSHPTNAWKEVKLPKSKPKTSWDVPSSIAVDSLRIELPPVDWIAMERAAVECAERYFWKNENGQVGQFISYQTNEFSYVMKGQRNKKYRSFGFIGADEVYKKKKYPPIPCARINGDLLEFAMGGASAPSRVLTVALNGVLTGGRAKWPILNEYLAIQQARSEKVSRRGSSAGVILGTWPQEGMGIDYTEKPKPERVSAYRVKHMDLVAKIDELEARMEDYRLLHPGSPSDYRTLCTLAGIEDEYLGAMHELDIMKMKAGARGRMA